MPNTKSINRYESVSLHKYLIDFLGMRSNYASAEKVLQMGVVTVILLSQLYVTS